MNETRIRRKLDSADPELRVYVNYLEAANAQLREQATRDVLTSFFNRELFEDHIENQVTEAVGHNRPFGIILDDIDHFKGINDTYGHAVGDEVIRQVARAKQHRVRPTDLLYRISGDEGAAILPLTAIEGAVALANSIKHCIEDLDIQAKVRKRLDVYAANTRRSPDDTRCYDKLEAVLGAFSGKPELKVTISQGVGVYPFDNVHTAAGLIVLTDRALYQAKESRNSVRTIRDLS